MVPLVGAGIFGQGILGCLPRYPADSSPTSAGGTGASAVIAAYWIGSIFMPAVFGAIMGAGHAQLVPIIAGILMRIGAAALLGARRIKPRLELEAAAQD